MVVSGCGPIVWGCYLNWLAGQVLGIAGRDVVSASGMVKGRSELCGAVLCSNLAWLLFQPRDWLVVEQHSLYWLFVVFVKTWMERMAIDYEVFSAQPHDWFSLDSVKTWTNEIYRKVCWPCFICLMRRSYFTMYIFIVLSSSPNNYIKALN